MTSSDYILIPLGYKQCSRGDKCVHPEGCVLPISYFGLDSHTRDKKKAFCKACQKQDNDRWLAGNREKNKIRCRRYYDANPEAQRQKTRRWNKKNTDKIRERNQRVYWSDPERGRERVREWTIRNPEKAKAGHHLRRARHLAAEGSFTPEDIELQFKSQRGKCWHCGKKFVKGDGGAKRGFHADHLFPLTKHKSNNPRNIVLACPRCNLSKGAKMPHEWNGKLF